MISHLTRFSLTALALAGFAGSAQAALVASTYGACAPGDGCDGSTIFLSIDDDDGSGNWNVTLTINVDSYSDAKSGFNQVGFKAIQGWDSTASYVISSPTDPIDDWNPIVEASINSSINGPCDPNVGNSNDQVCASGFVDITGNGEYTWTFYIVGGTLMTDTADWHLGAQYADGGGRSAGSILSTDGGGTPPIPEPTAALLFGLGAILVARRAQRS
jgi:hypothetical protein